MHTTSNNVAKAWGVNHSALCGKLLGHRQRKWIPPSCPAGLMIGPPGITGAWAQPSPRVPRQHPPTSKAQPAALTRGTPCSSCPTALGTARRCSGKRLRAWHGSGRTQGTPMEALFGRQRQEPQAGHGRPSGLAPARTPPSSPGSKTTADCRCRNSWTLTGPGSPTASRRRSPPRGTRWEPCIPSSGPLPPSDTAKPGTTFSSGTEGCPRAEEWRPSDQRWRTTSSRRSPSRRTRAGTMPTTRSSTTRKLELYGIPAKSPRPHVLEVRFRPCWAWLRTGTRTAGLALRLGRWRSPGCRGFRTQEWLCGSPNGRGDARGGPEAPASAPNPAAAQREPQEHRQRRKGTIKL